MPRGLLRTLRELEYGGERFELSVHPRARWRRRVAPSASARIVWEQWSRTTPSIALRGASAATPMTTTTSPSTLADDRRAWPGLLRPGRSPVSGRFKANTCAQPSARRDRPPSRALGARLPGLPDGLRGHAHKSSVRAHDPPKRMICRCEHWLSSQRHHVRSQLCQQIPYGDAQQRSHYRTPRHLEDLHAP